MTLADSRVVLADAVAAGVGVGAFNVVQLEHAEALVCGAEKAGVPVVLQVSQNTVDYHGALEPIGLATLAVGRAAAVPVVVHLDHAERVELVAEAVSLGFGSVMYDGSRLPYERNVATTAAVVKRCHDAGVAVEAELGEVGGKDGAHAPGVRTDPEQGQRFAAATGVDSLAVAVGTSHAMREQAARVDLDLVRALRNRVPVPLVLHGSSGVPDEDLGRIVAAGMTKINIATRLNDVLTTVVRQRLAADDRLVDPRKYLGPARDAVAEETARLLRLLARR